MNVICDSLVGEKQVRNIQSNIQYIPTSSIYSLILIQNSSKGISAYKKNQPICATHHSEQSLEMVSASTNLLTISYDIILMIKFLTTKHSLDSTKLVQDFRNMCDGVTLEIIANVITTLDEDHMSWFD